MFYIQNGNTLNIQITCKYCADDGLKITMKRRNIPIVRSEFLLLTKHLVPKIGMTLPYIL